MNRILNLQALKFDGPVDGGQTTQPTTSADPSSSACSTASLFTCSG